MNKKSSIIVVALLVLQALAVLYVPIQATPKSYEAYDLGPKIRSMNYPIDLSTIPDPGASVPSTSGGELTPIDTKVWLGLDDFNGYYFFTEFHLMVEGEKAEIWVQADLSWPPGDPRAYPLVTDEQLEYLLEEFESNIDPSVISIFSSPDFHDGSVSLLEAWGLVPPGYYYNEDGRTVILISNVRDDNYYDPEYPIFVAGFFSPSIEEYMDRNVITIDSYDWENRVGPDVSRPHDYEGTIAHEFEHLIHFDVDPDEKLWIDEGMADMAGHFCGYGHPQSHIAYYMVYHRTPLTSWGGGLEDYGESYLFQLYLMENFGGSPFTSALIAEQANGIEGVENQLAAFGSSASFNEVYEDWTIANYLDNVDLTGISGATLGYDSLDIPSADTWGYSIPWGVKNYYGSDNKGNLPLPRYWGGYRSGTVQYPLGSVLPYTPMYLTYKGFEPEFISTFRGDSASGVLPNSGDYELWGGRADLLFSSATLASPVTLGSNPMLGFWTYYEIEEYWDFGFVQVSTDGGFTWTSLENPSTTFDHDAGAIPDAVNNLPGFTGSSGGWVYETFDLSSYSGSPVLIRFLYVTDWAYTETGFYVDDVEVSDDSGTLFSDDLEGGPGSWSLDGWIYGGLVPNDWDLTFINPVYVKGRFSHFEFYDDSFVAIGDSVWGLRDLDTKYLNRDVVTVILSNYLPENSPFPAEYTLLVEKGNAK